MQQTLECSGVSPPSFELFPGHIIARDVSVIDVCDFQFAAPGRFQRTNDVVDVTVVHVNTNHGIIRLWLCGLLIDTNNPFTFEPGHAKTLRIGNFLKHDLGAATLLAITVDSGANVSLDYIVAEYDTDRIVRRKVL